jgi:hypothetical protein
VQDPRSRTIQLGALAVASITFLAIVLNQSKTLFFVWEEWTQLLDAADTPLWGIFQSHFGYVAPLSRLIFGIEAKFFGDWYTGYVAVNALLLLVFIWLVWWKLPIRSLWGTWFLTAGMVTFLFSAGAFFATSFAAMNGYFLCWLFGIIAIIAARSGKWLTATFAVVLSALSNNLMNVTVTFVVVATLLACLGQDPIKDSKKANQIKIVLLGALSLVLSAVLLFLGRFFPAADTSIGTSQSLSLPASSEIFDQANQFVALLTVWLGAPFVPLVAINQSLYQRSVIFLMDYHVVLIIGVLALAVVFYLTHRTGGRLIFLWLLLPIVAFAGQVVLFRGTQGFEARYTLMWFPAVVILWALWFEQMRGLTWLRMIGVALAGVTAVTAVIASPQFLAESVDLVRPRTELSVELRNQVQQCASVSDLDNVNESEALGQLAPSLTWEEVCRAHNFVGLN